MCTYVHVGGLLSAPTCASTWQGPAPLGGFGQVAPHSLGQPKTSLANQWPDVFGDSPSPQSGFGGFGKATSDKVATKKQISETSKGM